MDILKIEKQAHLAHAIMGYSGAALFVTLICVILFLLPKVNSLLATSQHASENVVTATGVLANSSTEETKQITQTTQELHNTVSNINSNLVPSLTKLVNATSTQVNTAGQLVSTLNTTVQNTNNQLTPLMASLTATSISAKTDIDTLNDSLLQTKPLLISATSTLTNFNEVLTGQQLKDALDGTAMMAKNGGAISTDFYKFEHPFLNPDPCTTSGCRFKRYILPPIKEITGISAEAESISRWFTPIPVTIKK